MQVVIEKQGDSAFVRIPAKVIAAASLSVGQPIEVREENGRIVIESARTPIYALEDLLAAMSPETFPPREDLGRPAGKEAW